MSIGSTFIVRTANDSYYSQIVLSHWNLFHSGQKRIRAGNPPPSSRFRSAGEVVSANRFSRFIFTVAALLSGLLKPAFPAG
jgi:hypothetical protein